MLDPTGIFRDPEEVVQNKGLTRAQKVEILRLWEFDALELQVAEEEGMGSGQPSGMLDRVLRALHSLKTGPDIEHSPPTKQGGI